ncbi:MAG TPA: hypothetical protein VJB06_04650, partial [archaeon]|nr:hypothetical protein [archaeon]
ALELVEIVNRDADKDDSGKVRSMEVASRDGFRPADRCPFIFSSLVLTQYLPSYITKELADLVELKRGKLWQENLPEEIVQRLRAARQLVERRQQQRRPRTRELITGD